MPYARPTAGSADPGRGRRGPRGHGHDAHRAAAGTAQAFTLAHVGDSRAYFLRDGQLGQITHDHTFVQTLVDEGRISADEAEHHPQRSLILRALGGRGRVEPDIDVIPARDGDRFLVCSDGLSGFVSVEGMTEGLGTGDIETAADRLIQMALDAGAPDNVTCLIGEVYESEDTGILPLTADGEAPSLEGILVGAAAEPDAPWSGAAKLPTTEQPDRRLLDPEDDSEENEAEVARYAPQAAVALPMGAARIDLGRRRRRARRARVRRVSSGPRRSTTSASRTTRWRSTRGSTSRSSGCRSRACTRCSTCRSRRCRRSTVRRSRTRSRPRASTTPAASPTGSRRGPRRASGSGRRRRRTRTAVTIRADHRAADHRARRRPTARRPRRRATSTGPTDEPTETGGSTDATTSRRGDLAGDQRERVRAAEPDFDDPVTREECGA